MDLSLLYSLKTRLDGSCYNTRVFSTNRTLHERFSMRKQARSVFILNNGYTAPFKNSTVKQRIVFPHKKIVKLSNDVSSIKQANVEENRNESSHIKNDLKQTLAELARKRRTVLMPGTLEPEIVSKCYIKEDDSLSFSLGKETNVTDSDITVKSFDNSKHKELIVNQRNGLSASRKIAVLRFMDRLSDLDTPKTSKVYQQNGPSASGGIAIKRSLVSLSDCSTPKTSNADQRNVVHASEGFSICGMPKESKGNQIASGRIVVKRSLDNLSDCSTPKVSKVDQGNVVDASKGLSICGMPKESKDNQNVPGRVVVKRSLDSFLSDCSALKVSKADLENLVHACEGIAFKRFSDGLSDCNTPYELKSDQSDGQNAFAGVAVKHSSNCFSKYSTEIGFASPSQIDGALNESIYFSPYLFPNHHLRRSVFKWKRPMPSKEDLDNEIDAYMAEVRLKKPAQNVANIGVAGEGSETEKGKSVEEGNGEAYK